MPKLSTISLFQEVVRSGSFSEAARKLGVPPSTVSRLIGSLEAELKIQLFFRSTRQLKLTDAGQFYFDCLTPLLGEIESVHQELADFNSEPRGVLRITAPTEFTRVLLAPLLSGYFAEFPNVRVELIVKDGYVDLTKDGIDLAIRFGRLKDTSLIARRLADDPAIVCASEWYLARFGVPEYPADLSSHNCLRFEPPGETGSAAKNRSLWTFQQANESFEVSVSGGLSANSVAPLIAAAVDNLGIVIAPAWSVIAQIEAGKLVQVLPEYEASWDTSDRGIYAIYPPTQYLPLKVRTFVDFLARDLRFRSD